MPPDIVVIVVDTLRKDHVSYFGDSPVSTDHIDRLARDGIAFHSAHPEALPTIPVRNGLLTGSRTLPHAGHGPIPERAVTLQTILGEYGYETGMVTDNFHYTEPGMNQYRGFDSFDIVRGQDGDQFRPVTPGVDTEPYVTPAMVDSFAAGQLRQYLANVRDRGTDPSSYFAGRVVSRAIEWLDRTSETGPRFLLVDSFDPHEPWDPPEPYRGHHTDPSTDTADLIYPKYGDAGWLSEAERSHVRGRYAEEVEYVDDQLGRLLEYLRDTGMYDESFVLLVGDHGIPLGEHGDMMKLFHALYTELIDVPLVLKPPTMDAFVEDADAVVQTHDIAPTVLDALGATDETRHMDGLSLLPVMRDDDSVRRTAITGYHQSAHRVARTPTWSYLDRPTGRPDELYDLSNDPEERRNVIDDYDERAATLRSSIPVTLRNPEGKT